MPIHAEVFYFVVRLLTNVERFVNIYVMKVTISNKYQVVIPKVARKKLNLGRDVPYMVIKNVTNNEITFSMPSTVPSSIESFAGILANEWGKKPMEKLRKLRDEEWG